MVKLSSKRLLITLFGTAHKKDVRNVLVGIATAASLVIVLQFLYPAKYTLPLTRFSKTQLGSEPVAKANEKLLRELDKATITVVAGDKQFVKNPRDIGLDFDVAATVAAAANYPWWQRLVPGSILRMAFTPSFIVTRDDVPKLRFFAEEVYKTTLSSPRDASVVIAGDEVTIAPARSGSAFELEQTVTRLRASQFDSSAETIRLSSQSLRPKRTDNELKPLLRQVRTIVDRRLTLVTQTGNRVVPKSIVASWIAFEQADGNTLRLTTDSAKVTGYLNAVQANLYQAPGVTIVATLDGNETGRTPGVPGRGVNLPATLGAIQAGFASASGAETTIPVQLVELPPTLSYNRSYSNSQAGLSALLGDLAQGSGNFGISVIELGGQSRVAHAGGVTQYITASTYKLFVAQAVLEKIQNNEWQWTQKIENDKTIEQCFELMIVRSDNPCAEIFGRKISWQSIQNIIRGQGLVSTTLGKEFYSTSHDLAVFVEKLHKGTYLKKDTQERLLDAMKRQVYRAAIPAGSGVTVANKPGFLDGYLHDVGIVYGSKGPYALAIMSKGSTWSELADVTRQIHDFMSR